MVFRNTGHYSYTSNHLGPNCTYNRHGLFLAAAKQRDCVKPIPMVDPIPLVDPIPMVNLIPMVDPCLWWTRYLW